jgi:transposase-like protein
MGVQGYPLSSREGISVALAAKDHGIHEATMYGWLGSGATSAPQVVGELTVKFSQAQKKI